MATVYLGLGSNRGNRRTYIEQALLKLRANGIAVVKCSSIMETAPVGGLVQEKFLNCVVKAHTHLTPFVLVKTVKTIEHDLGRKKTAVNGPRTIDIDILLYDQLRLSTPQLTIPHPQLMERDFVLQPLKEIEPRLVKELLHAHH